MLVKCSFGEDNLTVTGPNSFLRAYRRPFVAADVEGVHLAKLEIDEGPVDWGRSVDNCFLTA